MAAMLKPFAISPREQFTVLNQILQTASDNRDERQKRRQLWEEIGVVSLKRKLLRIQKPKPASAPQPDPLNDPDGVYAWQYADDEPTVRVALSQTTISFLVDKFLAKLEGVVGEVLGELCERLISLRDTADAGTICTHKGNGYHLPEELWTHEELVAAAPPPQATDEPMSVPST